jgi:hypothetical protein
LADFGAGLRFEFPAFAIGAALAAYGGTGVVMSQIGCRMETAYGSLHPYNQAF